MIQLRLFDSADEFVEYLRETLIPDLLESGRRSTAKDFEEAIHWITKKQQRKSVKRATKSPSKKTTNRTKSDWQKYIGKKSNQIKFKRGPRKGQLDLKRMSAAYKRSRK